MQYQLPHLYTNAPMGVIIPLWNRVNLKSFYNINQMIYSYVNSINTLCVCAGNYRGFSMHLQLQVIVVTPTTADL